MAEPQGESGKVPPEGAVAIIKKYANRRLYNTANSSYVTLDHLRDMVRAGQDFLVQDARTGEDITRSVLAQIIFEQESRGETLLPAQFLRKLIQFYGQSMQGFLPNYLEMSLEAFSKSREQFREQVTRTWGATTPLPTSGPGFEEQARQNVALFQQAMRMWATPLVGVVEPTAPAPPAPSSEGEALAELKRQMELMQKQLDQISATRSKGQS